MSPRAVLITEESLEVITRLPLAAPPHPDELLDVVLLPASYYFAVEWPREMRADTVPDRLRDVPAEWAIVPDFILEARYRFGATPSSTQLTSLVEL